MKKSAFPAALLLLGVLVSGCPVYENSDYGCFDDSDCAAGSYCDGASSSCVLNDNGAATCARPSDCGTNETCSRSGTCTAGDCHFSSVGCVRGYECSSDSGRWECVKPGTGSGDAGGGGMTNSGGMPSSEAGGQPDTSASGAPPAAGG